jgi:hypothetical protein
LEISLRQVLPDVSVDLILCWMPVAISDLLGNPVFQFGPEQSIRDDSGHIACRAVVTYLNKTAADFVTF